MPTPLEEPALRTFLCAQFQLAPAELAPDTALFSAGLLDSFHLIELIAFLEKTAGIRVAPGEISLENLDTPARLLQFVARKQTAAAP
jgi:acyl carrier protein